MELKVREIIEALSGQAEPFDPSRADDNDQAKDRLVSSLWGARESEATLGAKAVVTSLNPSQSQ